MDATGIAALERECNANDFEVKVLRPMRGGKQTVTIKIEEEQAKNCWSKVLIESACHSVG